MLITELPCDPEIPLLGIYSREMKAIHTKTCTQVFIAALFITVKKWKQPECSSAGCVDKQNVVLSLQWNIIQQ